MNGTAIDTSGWCPYCKTYVSMVQMHICTDTKWRRLAQSLATVLARYERKFRYTSDEMDEDAIDVLLEARAAGLEVVLIR